MAGDYISYNGPMPTTAAQVAVTTGTAVKTLLQVATPSDEDLVVIAWGISFDGTTPSNAPVKCELMATDVAATVTAHVAAGVQPWTNAGGPASRMTLGTAATGYTASAEGSITAVRMGDHQQVNPTTGYSMWFPPEHRFHVPVSRFLRVRVTATVAVNAIAWILWAE